VDVPTQDMGSVEDVVDYAGNIVFTIQINGKEVLLPLSDDIVLDVDDENGILYVSITEELYNLN
jgi:16S rRNA processing protein RimM